MQYYGLATNNSQPAGCGNHQRKKSGFFFFAPLLPLKLGSNFCGCCKSFVSEDFFGNAFRHFGHKRIFLPVITSVAGPNNIII